MSTRVWNSHCTNPASIAPLGFLFISVVPMMSMFDFDFALSALNALSRLSDEKKSVGLLLIVTEILLYSKVRLL